MHGNEGSLQGWIDSGVLPNLVRDYRVVALDARGHGQSGKPHDVKAYGREMGLDFQELKKLRPGVKLVVIEGASHGGDRGAMRRPEFVAAVREFISSNGGTASR